jgi:hypothetical protein
MPESGLGSQAALGAAALPGFVFPSDLEPSSRWFGPSADVIELRMAADGTMEVPDTSIASRLDMAVFRRAARRLH